ncbi:hypothetical protein PF010_g17993 [Phytophthora fragariae]|uniref:Uncharacterized protein n=1 Tax=Phytophthora fragariae TaxID=53985 RepID=A0A6A3EVT5_9STRA|nr:hypothetical protein PF009_g12602 [Phytophthora fragariae]KAE8992726.1 hypothetical protein PF011_g17441 [Phytophthora fragariae]KAE9091939.1 hypothetical protein PF010_g17993 [Phytophthora fragariae]KAE9144521.1 hypothetical protein PF006_g10553 [Phytophthora fragariae]
MRNDFHSFLSRSPATSVFNRPLDSSTMVSPKLAVGDLAFIDPAHAPALAEFGYVKVHRLDGSDAISRMAATDLDDGDDSQELSLPIDTLQLRIVDTDEANL